MRGPFLDNCFGNHINNQYEKLLNGADIYGLYFQGDGAKIKDKPLLHILDRLVYLPLSVQKLWTVEVTSQVVTRRMQNLLWRVSLIQ